MLSNNHSFPPLHPQCIYGGGTNGCFPNNYATYAPHYSTYPMPLSYQQTLMKPPTHYGTNGFCCGGGGAYPPAAYAIPTGQLIELGGGYDGVDGKRQKNVIVNNVEASDREEGGFENWDYVYKNLESQGYSKDLGERGDILEYERNPSHRNNNKTKTTTTNLDEILNNLTVAERPLKINEALEKYKENDENNRKKPELKNTTPSSSYENLSHTKQPKTNKPKPKLETTKKMKNATDAMVSDEKKKQKTNVLNKWQCRHCTFFNENARDICEMCSKSKVIVEQKMEIGGSQCPKCTLVNPRESTNCQACDESLKDSPTYI